MRRAVIVVLSAIALASCSTSESFEKLPESLGGLPADAPVRPKTPYQYPAVHDMPAQRPEKTLNDAELLKLEKELQDARERQEKAAAAAPEAEAPPKPAPAPKPKGTAQPKKRAADKAGTTDKP